MTKLWKDEKVQLSISLCMDICSLEIIIMPIFQPQITVMVSHFYTINTQLPCAVTGWLDDNRRILMMKITLLLINIVDLFEKFFANIISLKFSQKHYKGLAIMPILEM